MAGVYSVPLLNSGVHPPPSLATYAVPVGFVMVVRNIQVNYFGRPDYSGGYGPAVFTAGSALTGVNFWSISSNAQNRVYWWEGREVLDYLDGLAVWAGVTQMQYSVNGYLLKAT